MQQAMWLASVFGPVLVIVGLWSVFYHSQAVKTMASLKTNPSAVFALVIINLIVGLSIINSYNEWAASASVFVSLLGWAFFFRGLLFLFAQQFMLKYCSKSKVIYVRGTIGLVWGLILCWFAFWA
jgi:hypothetical protein